MRNFRMSAVLTVGAGNDSGVDPICGSGGPGRLHLRPASAARRRCRSRVRWTRQPPKSNEKFPNSVGSKAVASSALTQGFVLRSLPSSGCHRWRHPRASDARAHTLVQLFGEGSRQHGSGVFDQLLKILQRRQGSLRQKLTADRFADRAPQRQSGFERESFQRVDRAFADAASGVLITRSSEIESSGFWMTFRYEIMSLISERS